MKKIIYYSLLATGLLSACKKQVDPLAFPAHARINFFNATQYPARFIAVDTPDFQPGAALDWLGRESYPLAPAGSGAIGHGAITYMALPAGPHYFYFADTARILRAAKELTLQAGSYTALYLTDSLLHYDVVEVPAAPLAQHPGKIRIRILNLAPDVLLNIKMVDQDGNQYSDGLPQAIPYKGISPAIEPEMAQALDGSFFLRFYHKEGDGEVLVGTAPAVSAVPGKAYTFVVRGYREDHLVDTIQFNKGVVASLRVEH